MRTIVLWMLLCSTCFGGIDHQTIYTNPSGTIIGRGYTDRQGKTSYYNSRGLIMGYSYERNYVPQYRPYPTIRVYPYRSR